MAEHLHLAKRWETGERTVEFSGRGRAVDTAELAEWFETMAEWLRSGSPMPLEWRAQNCPFELEITGYHEQQ